MTNEHYNLIMASCDVVAVIKNPNGYIAVLYRNAGTCRMTGEIDTEDGTMMISFYNPDDFHDTVIEYWGL